MDKIKNLNRRVECEKWLETHVLCIFQSIKHYLLRKKKINSYLSKNFESNHIGVWFYF